MMISQSIFVSVLVVILCVLFSNTLHNEFCFDDGYAITGNDDALARSHWTNVFVHDFWGQDISADGSHKSYRPVTTFTFRFNSLFHQYFEHSEWYESFCTSTMNKTPLLPPERPILRSEFFHIVNIFLHGVVTLLIGALVHRMCSKGNVTPVLGFIPVWFISSCFYLLHPVHVEAVTGIVGRAELLCGVFMLIGLWYWSFVVIDRETLASNTLMRYYIICFISFVLAIFSKETAFALPILYLGFLFIWNTENLKQIVYWTHRADKKFLFFNILFWGSVSLVYILFRTWLTVHLSVTANRQLENPIAFMDDFWFRNISKIYIHWKYFWLLIFPNELSCDYSLNCIPMIESLKDPRIILAVGFYVFLLVALVGGIVSFPNCKTIQSTTCMKIYIFSWCILLLTFFPASNILVFVGTLIAERILYLPSIGFCILFSLLWHYLDKILKSKVLRILLCLAICCYFVWLGMRTYQRNFDWENEEILFKTAALVCPNSGKILENLGVLERRYERFDEALEYFKKAKQVWPAFCDVDYWKGITLVNQGNMREAIKTLMSTLNCKHAVSNSIVALKTIYDSLSTLYPNAPEFWVWWADSLVQVDMAEAAVPIYAQAARIHIDKGALLLNTNSLEAYQEFVMACKYADASIQNPSPNEALMCKIYLMKGICDTQLGVSPQEIARSYVRSASCNDTHAHSISGILALQKADPYDPVLHECWADVVTPIDPLQGFKHYKACIDILLHADDTQSALSCAFKLVEAYRIFPAIQKDPTCNISAELQLLQHNLQHK